MSVFFILTISIVYEIFIVFLTTIQFAYYIVILCFGFEPSSPICSSYPFTTWFKLQGLMNFTLLIFCICVLKCSHVHAGTFVVMNWQDRYVSFFFLYFVVLKVETIFHFLGVFCSLTFEFWNENHISKNKLLKYDNSFILMFGEFVFANSFPLYLVIY